MNSLKTANILNAIIPISRFNKGEANKIFAEVKKDGTRIVVKNNIPECILMSPKEWKNMKMRCLLQKLINGLQNRQILFLTKI